MTAGPIYFSCFTFVSRCETKTLYSNFAAVNKFLQLKNFIYLFIYFIILETSLCRQRYCVLLFCSLFDVFCKMHDFLKLNHYL